MCALIKKIREVNNSIFTKPVYDFTGKFLGYEESDEHYEARKKKLLKRRKRQ